MSRSHEHPWPASLLRRGLTIIVACGTLLLAPSLASANMTVTTSAASGVTVSGCTFTAAAATSNVNLSALTTCLDTSGKTTTLVDGVAGGGDVDFTGAVSATGCSDGTFKVENSEGAININAPIDLGTDDCAFDPEALTGGNITQSTTAASAITTMDLFPKLTGAGTLDLDATNNAIGSLGGEFGGEAVVYDAEALVIDTIEASSAQTFIEAIPGITVDGSISAGALVGLEAEDGSVNESTTEVNPPGISTPFLGVISSSPDALNGTNSVGMLTVNSASSFNLTDQPTDGLVVGALASGGNATITTSGDLTLSDSQTLAYGTLSLTSSTGSISEVQAGALQAPTLDLSAPAGQIDLGNANTVNSLQASAGAGALDFANVMAPLTLSGVSASGAVTVGDASEPMDISGTVAGTNVALTGSGFSGVGGQITAANVQLSDSTAGDAWTVTPGLVTDGANGAIPFSGTSGLSISGGDTFNVTASPATTFTFAGGSPAAGTLNYNAQGRVVSGTTAAPSGEIDSASVDPVDFSGMQAVNLSDVGTAPPVTTPTTPTQAPTPTSTTTTSPSPGTDAPVTSCTLRAPSARVSGPVRTKTDGRVRTSPATLKLAVTCLGAATATVTGKLTVTEKLPHPKAGAKQTTTKHYTLSAVKASVARGVTRTFVIDVPTAVLAALSVHHAVSATFTLRYTVRGGDAGPSRTLALKRLTL